MIILLVVLVAAGYLIFKPASKQTDDKDKDKDKGKGDGTTTNPDAFDKDPKAPKPNPADRCARKFKRDPSDGSFKIIGIGKNHDNVDDFVNEALPKGWTAELIYVALGFLKGMDLEISFKMAEKYRKDINKFKLWAVMPDLPRNVHTTTRLKETKYNPGELICEENPLMGFARF